MSKPIGVEYKIKPLHQQTGATCWYTAFVMMLRWHQHYGILKKLEHKWGPFFQQQKNLGLVPGGNIDSEESSSYVHKNHGKALGRSALQKLITQYNLNTSVIAPVEPKALLNVLANKKPLVHMAGRSNREQGPSGPTVGHCVTISGILIKDDKATVAYADPLGGQMRNLSFDGFMKRFPPFWESGKGFVVVHL